MCSRRIGMFLLTGLLLMAPVRAQYVAPYNMVVIVLDASLSFQQPSAEPGVEGRVPVVEALATNQRLFAATAGQERQRYDGDDRYAIVAADAASQVIWSGNRAGLAGLTGDALIEMLKIRKQFAHCTDYAMAMNAAAKVLKEHADATNRFVLTFGDLIHDPPTTSYRNCAGASGEPPAGIDWDTLGTASLGFYFVSTNFTLRPNQRWLTLLESRGLKPDFKDMAQTLSQPLELPPPPPAVYKPTKEQTAAAQQQWLSLRASAKTFAKWGAGLALAGVSLLIGLIVALRKKAASGQSRRSVNNG